MRRWLLIAVVEGRWVRHPRPKAVWTGFLKYFSWKIGLRSTDLEPHSSSSLFIINTNSRYSKGDHCDLPGTAVGDTLTTGLLTYEYGDIKPPYSCQNHENSRVPFHIQYSRSAGIGAKQRLHSPTLKPLLKIGGDGGENVRPAALKSKVPVHVHIYEYIFYVSTFHHLVEAETRYYYSSYVSSIQNCNCY